MKNLICIIVLILCSCTGTSIQNVKLLRQYQRFEGTKAEILAKAVMVGDTLEIKEQVLNYHIPVDFKENEFGSTLLNLATIYNNLKSVKCLLELGADPNLYEDTIKSWGYNSVLNAAFCADNPEILRLLIAYGGDPDSQAKGVINYGMEQEAPNRDLALQLAARSNIEKVKILLNAGADINKTGPEYFQSPIYSSLSSNHMDILLYLLRHGADYTIKFRQIDLTSAEKKEVEHTIVDRLRWNVFPLNSKLYIQKMRVVKFLASKGLDYSKAPIPEWVVNWAKRNYPDNWEEYLEKY